LGLDTVTLVIRCQIETHRAGAARSAPAVGFQRLVQRLRWNGGALQISEERR